MEDPVIAADGHSYEREAIEDWLQYNSTSPKTNVPLPHKGLTPNHTLRALIGDFSSSLEGGEGRRRAGEGAGL